MGTPATAPSPTLSALVIEATDALYRKESAQFKAFARLSDASQREVTSEATWSSSNNAVASVTAAGVVTASGIGSARIGATYQGLSGSAQLEVSYDPNGDRLTLTSLKPMGGGTVPVNNGSGDVTAAVVEYNLVSADQAVICVSPLPTSPDVSCRLTPISRGRGTVSAGFGVRTLPTSSPVTTNELFLRMSSAFPSNDPELFSSRVPASFTWALPSTLPPIVVITSVTPASGAVLRRGDRNAVRVSGLYNKGNSPAAGSTGAINDYFVVYFCLGTADRPDAFLSPTCITSTSLAYNMDQATFGGWDTTIGVRPGDESVTTTNRVIVLLSNRAYIDMYGRGLYRRYAEFPQIVARAEWPVTWTWQ